MATETLGLFLRTPKKRALPFHPIAMVYVKCCTKDDKGTAYLTPDCATFQELDYWLRFLERELREIRRKGRSKFAKLDKTKRGN